MRIATKLILVYVIFVTLSVLLTTLFVINSFENLVSLSAHADEIRSKATTIILSVEALAVIIGMIFARTISEPILKIHRATEELRKENYSFRLNINSNDEFGELAENFNLTSQELSDINKKRRELRKEEKHFISVVSHELRSPLTPMQMQLEMLEDGTYGRINKKQKESVSMILRNLSRVDRTLLDLLEITKMESARLRFNYTTFNPENIIKDCIDTMNHYMPEKKVKLKLINSRLPKIQADPDRFSQILRNTIGNAIKFSKQNAVVNILAKKENAAIRVDIQDFGPGMSKEDQKRVFEPFYQSEKTIDMNKTGSGLGLSVCKGLIESQNGKIWITSKPGSGTTVRFTIPLKPPKNAKSVMFWVFKK